MCIHINPSYITTRVRDDMLCMWSSPSSPLIALRWSWIGLQVLCASVCSVYPCTFTQPPVVLCLCNNSVQSDKRGLCLHVMLCSRCVGETVADVITCKLLENTLVCVVCLQNWQLWMYLSQRDDVRTAHFTSLQRCRLCRHILEGMKLDEWKDDINNNLRGQKGKRDIRYL